MKCTILHLSQGRMRVHMNQYAMSLEQADILEQYLNSLDFVTHADVHERTGNAVIQFKGPDSALREALSSFRYDSCGISAAEHTGRELSRQFEEKIFWHVARRLASRLFLPVDIRSLITACKSVPFVIEGLKVLAKGKLEVAALDATAIMTAMLTNDFDTAGSIMFLLGLSEILEDYTHRKSVDDLARTMSLNIDKVWLKTDDGEEVLANIGDIEQGDHLILRTSNTIPLDGVVVSGQASVNQASMTGESLPVNKEAGDPVYAGTVVEEGECVIEVRNTAGEGRYDRIVRMIDESEKLKSETENRAARLADRLVPYSFIGTALTYLFSRDINRAMAVLMVDYSCALKLSMPISVLSAMRECAGQKISVKGGKFLENIADADTVVFDKTGTLTYSKPTVAMVIPFNGSDENEDLRLAACLEEHYPHSIANAVVSEASVRGLLHEEKHSKVEYVVAHGIASSIDGMKTVIGSYHFVFEDEKCVIPEDETDKFNAISDGYSQLYLAVGGVLTAVICIEDPIRSEAKDVIAKLKKHGITKAVMMTGDSERTAARIAKMVNVDAYYSEVLPEDKAAFIKREHEEERRVIMIGDGINDSPALAEADCGIAVSDGAAIAREIADVTIADDDLYALLSLKEIADGLNRRIHNNYRFIMSFNSALILLGAFGILSSTATAYLHNLSTLAISMRSMSEVAPGKQKNMNR